MRVEMVGNKMTCYLSREKVLEDEDDTLKDVGIVTVDLWSKADAANSFDNMIAAAHESHDQ